MRVTRSVLERRPKSARARTFRLSLFRVRGKSRPGPTPFLLSHTKPPVLYFLLRVGIPAAALYALLLKASPPARPLTLLGAPATLSFPPPSFVPPYL